MNNCNLNETHQWIFAIFGAVIMALGYLMYTRELYLEQGIGVFFMLLGLMKLLMIFHPHKK